jgi:hypothetical protein
MFLEGWVFHNSDLIYIMYLKNEQIKTSQQFQEKTLIKKRKRIVEKLYKSLDINVIGGEINKCIKFVNLYINGNGGIEIDIVKNIHMLLESQPDNFSVWQVFKKNIQAEPNSNSKKSGNEVKNDIGSIVDIFLKKTNNFKLNSNQTKSIRKKNKNPPLQPRKNQKGFLLVNKTNEKNNLNQK